MAAKGTLLQGDVHEIFDDRVDIATVKADFGEFCRFALVKRHVNQFRNAPRDLRWEIHETVRRKQRIVAPKETFQCTRTHLALAATCGADEKNVLHPHEQAFVF